MTNKNVLWLWLLPCLVLCSTTAQAHPDVDEARAAFERGDFLATLSRLQRAEQSPTLSEDEMVALYWYRGAANHVLRRMPETNRAFDALLELRPLHTPDEGEAAPDLLRAYQGRVDAFAKRCPGAIQTPRLEGRDVVFQLETSPCRPVERVVVFARPHGARTFTPHEALALPGLVRVTVRDNAMWDGLKNGGTLEVVVEARNARGVAQLRAGDAVRPLMMDIPGAQLPPVAAAPQPTKPVAAPAPGPTTPAPAPDAAAPAEGGAAPGGLVRPASIALAVGGAVAFVVGLLPLLPLGAAALAFLYVDNRLKQNGAQRDPNWATLQTVWSAGVYSTAAFGALAGLGGLVALAGAAAVVGGVALFFVGDGL